MASSHSVNEPSLAYTHTQSGKRRREARSFLLWAIWKEEAEKKKERKKERGGRGGGRLISFPNDRTFPSGISGGKEKEAYTSTHM